VAAPPGEALRLTTTARVDERLDGFAALRPHETVVVVLEPRTVAG
jgi:hypothetical protein